MKIIINILLGFIVIQPAVTSKLLASLETRFSFLI